jgi:molybdopterin-guanine dinucleotide biosynthesis protein A
MGNLSQELNAAGFIIYPQGSRFTMMKVGTPVDDRMLEPTHFDTYEQAADKAEKIFIHKELRFTAIVRYSRGLGIEYRNVAEFSVNDKEDAQQAAEDKAYELLGEDVEIREVRIREC